ncbi:HEAT repeat domain-containing protein [Acaryochloris marina]|uniref:HEAT repeat domain-containing protein n=1 Tax=Acaryochloris marina TaxID=155978 RepID=UPI0002F8015C|nr:hypothetical protein [Acaryochloris marina]
MVKLVNELIADLRSQARHDDAYDLLWDMGEDAVETLFITLCDDEEENQVRESCSQLMGHVIPEGVNQLLVLLEKTQGDQADLAAWGLRYNHAPAIIEPQLFKLLQDSSPTIRANAARALRYIHIDLQTFDSRLLEALQDECIEVRLDVLRILIELVEVGLEQYGVCNVTALAAAVHTRMNSS